MKNKWYIILNPKSGSGRSMKKWAAIKAYLELKKILYEVVFTEYKTHAIELTKQAIVEKGYRHFVAIGGDGTANEVMNGIAQQSKVPTKDITFAMIPVGTGNDWVRTHKIPTDYKKAIDLLIQGRTDYHDIGWVSYQGKDGKQEMRYFTNVAGTGYDAFVTKKSNEQPNFTSNKLFYLYLIFSCLNQYKAIPCRVILDNQEVIEDDIYVVTIGVCIYNAGGARFVPHAIYNDGLLAVTIVRAISPLNVIRSTPKFYDGKIGEHPLAKQFQVKSLRIEPINPQNNIGVETDGEYLGLAPMEFGIYEKAVKVIK